MKKIKIGIISLVAIVFLLGASKEVSAVTTISVSPSSLTFTAPVNVTPAAQTFILSNTGAFISPYVTNNMDFSLYIKPGYESYCDIAPYDFDNTAHANPTDYYSYSTIAPGTYVTGFSNYLSSLGYINYEAWQWEGYNGYQYPVSIRMKPMATAGTYTCQFWLVGNPTSIYPINTLPLTITYTVTAPTTYTLSLAKAGTGTGTVTSSPAGISCGTSCASASYAFTSGTSVTLTATPASGSYFAGWSGACSGTGTCVTTMSAARSVTATFTASPVVNNVTISSSTVVPNNVNQYNITIVGSEATGGSNLYNMYALINQGGTNAASRRGYLLFHPTTTWTGYKDARSCSGGGYAAINSGFGDTYLRLDACSTSVSGNMRTTVFTVRFDGSFTTPTTLNDISGYVCNASSVCYGWLPFDINFGLSFEAPKVEGVTISSPTVVPNNTTQYVITLVASDPTGGSNLRDMYTLINYQGTNLGNHRGYLTWYPTDAWPSYQDHQACTGGGYAVVQPGYGNEYIHLDACSTSVSGTMRTNTFTVRFQTAYTTPTTLNDISGYTYSTVAGVYSGWANSDINFSVNGNTAPNAPTITGPTTGHPNTSYIFDIVSTDPQSNTVRYGVDWGMDGTADVWLPASSYVNSGTSQSISNTWTTTGTKTFQVLAQDSPGLNSSWTTRTITLSAKPVLTVTLAGTGSGTVTSSPAGITCGADCTESYASIPSATSVTLTATPNSGSVFSGWSGDSDCTDGVVSMSASKTCTATFVPRYTITIQKELSVGGSVSSADGFISCGSTCSYTYTSGSNASLTATPKDSSWKFVGWKEVTPGYTGTKVCTTAGTGSCSITGITRDMTIKAYFVWGTDYRDL